VADTLESSCERSVYLLRYNNVLMFYEESVSCFLLLIWFAEDHLLKKLFSRTVFVFLSF